METQGKAQTGVEGLDDILAGGLQRGRRLSDRRQPRHRQDDHRDAVPARRAQRRASAGSTSPCRRPRRSCARARPRTAGRSTSRSTSSSWSRRKACSTRISSRACSIRPTWSSAKRPSASSRRSSEANPRRVVIDSLSEIRLLAQSSLRYRRQVLALKHYFARNGATVLMLDDLTTDALDKTVHSVAHGVHPAGGAGARIWRRAAAAAGDQISRPALPRRLPRLHHRDRRRARSFRAWFPPSTSTSFERDALPSDSAELDALLGGGIERGLEHAGPGPGRHRQVAARR